MAELENRMISEGRSPEDIVPYIERINLYVADEIDHLKQAQKEVRATLNEVLERLERREAHSTPMPPPAPPMAHPHRSPVPHTELRSTTKVHHEQRVHAVEGAATVNTHTSEVVTTRKRVKDGKIRAVEGGIAVSQAAAPVAAPARVTLQPLVAAAPAKEQAIDAAPAAAKHASSKAADGKKIPSDEAAWDHAPGAAQEPESDEAMPPEIEATTEASASDEADEEPAHAAKPKAKPAKPTKPSTPAKPAAKTKAAKPMVPRAAPVQTSRASAIETTLGAAPIPAGAPAPFAAAPKAEKVTKSKDSKPAKKAKEKSKDKVAAKPAEKPKAKDAHAKAAPAAKPAHSDEDLLGAAPEVAQGGDDPTEEQLANWKGGETPKIESTVGSASVTASGIDTKTAQARIAGATESAAAKKAVRTDKASSLLAEMRAKVGKK